MKRLFVGEVPAPDHLRCRRSDGRGWRCPRPALDPVRFCEHHYRLQRRNTEKHLAAVAKLKRKKPRRVAHVRPPEPLPDRRSRKRRRQMDELIGMALLRQMERREERDRMRMWEAAAVEVTRDLPNGVMAIASPPCPPRVLDNAAPPLDQKIGFNPGHLFHRCFRSKNAESLPLGSRHEFPYRTSLTRVGKKKVCHRCTESKLARMVRCSACWKFFCTSCIEKWYPKMSKLDLKVACPICRGGCTCKTCLQYGIEDGGHKELANNKKRLNKIRYAHYLICQLFPVLKEMNAEHIIELELEANKQGRILSGVQLQVVEHSHDEIVHCNYCKVSIVDFHRSCSKCSYKLCLRCCREIRGGSLTRGVALVTYRYLNEGKAYKHASKEFNGMTQRLPSSLHPDCSLLSASPMLSERKVKNDNGSISCPSKKHGGCGDGILDLIFILPLGSTPKLDMTSKQIARSYGHTGSLQEFCMKVVDTSRINGVKGSL